MPQGVNFNILDNGLGLAPAGTGNTIVVIGVSSQGTPNQPFFSTQPGPFITTFSYGPGPELAAYIAHATGNNTGFVSATTVTPGSNSAVTTTRAPGTPSTSNMTLTGTPLDTYYGNVKVLNGGTVGTTGIVLAVSLDATRTVYVTASLLTANTYVVANTGLTLNFSAGTLNVGDVFTWTSTEPAWSDATVTSAIQSLQGMNVPPYVDILIAGASANADATAFDAQMNALFLKKRFARLILHARDVLWGGTSTESEVTWMNAISTDYSTFQSVNGRTHVTAGHYNFISPISQVQFRRPLLWGAGARDSQVAIQVDLGRVLDGSIPMVLPALPDGFVYHNENQLSGLDAARFMSMWNIQGLPGLYIMNPNSMAAPGSDFKWLQYGHVIDAACVIAYAFFSKQLSNQVRVDATKGTILPQDASALETGCNRQLATGLNISPGAPGAVSSASTKVDRSTNILSTQQLNVTISIVPLAYLKTINVTLTFLNPALVQVASAIGVSP